jgi:hypothetical protein
MRCIPISQVMDMCNSTRFTLHANVLLSSFLAGRDRPLCIAGDGAAGASDHEQRTYHELEAWIPILIMLGFGWVATLRRRSAPCRWQAGTSSVLLTPTAGVGLCLRAGRAGAARAA